MAQKSLFSNGGENDGKECIISASFGAGKACAILLSLSLVFLIAALFVLPHVRYMFFALLCLLAFATATLGLYIGSRTQKEILEVSDKIIFGKTLFGSEMYLPASEITSVGVTAFGGVSITTGNYILRCYFVKNREQIVSEILKLIK